jgi:hypothetical protein
MRAEWPKLNTLLLSNNHVGSEGVRHLAGSKWPLLRNIDLSII